MSRIAKWKFEKTKVKVVFRLQFHATHIPQTGWDKLFISCIPADSGKATAKTTKANVRNGTCKWGDPIYETTRLLQDLKTKLFDEKFYKLVVAMGSSRTSVLGEATINLADYVDALKPFAVALPLHGSDFGTVLHVTVQLLTSKTGFREFEQQRELREKGLQNDQSSTDGSSGSKVLSSEEISHGHMDKVNARVRFKEKSKNLTSLEDEVVPNEDYADSAVGFDGSSNTSGSLYAEKHDSLSTNEVESLKSTVSGDLAGLSLGQTQQEKGDNSDNRFSGQGASDWIRGWSSDCSADNDFVALYEENGRLRGSLEVAESSIVELKLEVNSLQSHADEIGFEVQKFAKQLATEIASGEELAKEVSLLKSECSILKNDFERLKICKVYPRGSGEAEAAQNHMFQDSWHRWMKGLLFVEEKTRELQGKACFGFHERDLRFLHVDFEALLAALENLKQGFGQTVSGLKLSHPQEASMKEIGEISVHKNGQFLTGNVFDVDAHQTELGMLQCLGIPEPTDATNAMKGKIFELLRELDESKSERESLAKKMGEMECYYEALVQELEENQRQMLVEIQNLKNEHSNCLYTVSSTKAEMEIMHKDLNGQIMSLSEDKHHLDTLNKELERRAVTAEAALKRARLNYSIAMNHLQKDLVLLSSQVSSMFETNENLIRQVVDSSQLNPQKLDYGEFHEVEVLQHENNFGGVKKQQLGGDIISDDLKRSLYLQEGLYLKIEEEVNEMHFVNLYLDVFSKTLHETLLDASTNLKLMQEKLNELAWKLELSNEAKELLMQKLQVAINDVDSLNEYKAVSIAKCNEMALQNHILEKNLQNITHENHLLMQKVKEWESLAIQYQSYESRYEACAAERTDLACLLENKSVENENLQHEIFSLQEELKAVKIEFNQLASVKENMQNCVNMMETKLQNMLASCEKSIAGLPPLAELGNYVSRDSTNLIMQLQEFHENACAKILQLTKDNKALMHERDVAQMSSSAAELNIVSMKSQFECNVWNMVDRLNVSNVLVQKLQMGVEAIANRFKVSTEAEERHAQMQVELLSVLNLLEDELQELISKNADLADEAIMLESVADELGISKLKAVELAKKNQDLMLSLQYKNEESSRLASELETLKESVKYLRDGNHALLASSKEKVEESSLLASELNGLKDCLQSMHTEKEALMALSQDKAEEAAKLLMEVSSLKESLRILQDENQALVVSSCDRVEECAKLTLELNSSGESLRSLHNDNQALVVSLRDKMEESAKLLSQLSSLNESMQSLHDEKQALMLSLRDKTEEVSTLVSEINSLKENLQSLINENQDLKESMEGETEKSAHLMSEINGIRECFQSLQDELQDERCLRTRLESIVDDLSSRLNEKQGEYLLLDQCQSELVHLKQMVSELESEKSRANDLMLQYEESLKNVQEESSSVSTLETLLSETNELLVATEVRFIFTENQYRSFFEELVEIFDVLDRKYGVLQKKHSDVEANLNQCLGREAQLVEENAKLLTSLRSSKSEIEAFVAKNSLLLEKNRAITVELDEYKGRSQGSYCEDEGEDSSMVEELKRKLINSEEEVDYLMLAMKELEIKVLVYEAKLDEQKNLVISLQGYIDELSMLREQCNELTQKLSEQVMKTEEFKNLSVHLKELKDKADAERVQALERKEPDVPPAAVQDSLRIAFIKEHYEGKLQELKQQQSISKKHSEEMLWKLQDALDEIEKRKKSEVLHLKKNEELGMKILDMEEELQSALADKHERTSAYDLMKAEMECSLISLECCKEEKQKLELSLRECKEENSRIAAEITLLKETVEILKSVKAFSDEGNNEFAKVDDMSSIERAPTNERENTRDKNVDTFSWNGSVANTNLNHLRQETYNSREEAEHACSSPDDEIGHSSPLKIVPDEQDVLVSDGVSSLHEHQEKLQNSDIKQLVLINDRFKAESLRSSMDHLSNELEKMKNDNSLILANDDEFQQKFPGLQSELMQLRKANEELGSMFPLFNEFSRNGNALERVLALEIELAEALQTKKKSSIHFQSSFLKQHSDEEAIFKSFRDINDLIKDMLELKGRYETVETELKEMHDRYSQLSLQFAEVEGERQKLTVTLKNVRASRKALNLSRSSSATLGDHPL